MMKIMLLFLLAPLLAAAALAQAGEAPTIAILRYGGPAGDPIFVEARLISMLENYGYVSVEEADRLYLREDVAGENINVYWGDAGWDIPTANLMVRRALDQGADVLVTVTTPVSRAAINVTLDLEDPPLVLTSSLLYPYATGIAKAPCVKPDHLIGVAVEVEVDLLFSLMQVQQPDIQRIGILASSTEVSGIEGAASLEALALSHGLEASLTTIISQSDAILAAEGLASKDIEALITSWDVLISHNMKSIVEAAADAGIPLYIPLLPAVTQGAAISAGYLHDNEETIMVARLLASWLAGDLDPATTSLAELRGAGTGLNLDVLDSLGMTAADALLEGADVIVENGAIEFSDRYFEALIAGDLNIPVEQNHELDASIVAGLQCTEEMIAEQRAALAAAEG